MSKGIAQPASGVEDVWLFPDRVDVGASQMLFQHVGLVMKVGHDRGGLNVTGKRQSVVDQCAACDLYQRLGLMRCQMLHPGPKSGGKKHQGNGIVAHWSFSFCRRAGVGAGSVASISGLMDAKAG